MLFDDWILEEIPKMFGTFHCVSLIICLFTCICFYLLARKRTNKKDFIVITVVISLLIISEIYKQVFHYSLSGKYNWGAFPFQLCSVPMYLGIINLFLKEGKVRDAIYRFIAFTGIVGGAAMMIVASHVLGAYVILNIHTMFWHTSLMALGIYLVKARGYGKNILKETLHPAIILAIVVVMAVFFNFILHEPALKNNVGVSLISLSYYTTNYPLILDSIFKIVPYPIYVLIVYTFLYLSMPLVTSITYLIRLVYKKLKR